MKVTISKPCHEDWNKMTPTQQGAFCHKCQLNVRDFSKNSPAEIKTILLQNRNTKICGRISNSQLDSINSDYSSWTNQTTKTFYSKFTWACLIVFGFSLFSSCNDSNATEKNTIDIADTPSSPHTIKKDCSSPKTYEGLERTHSNPTTNDHKTEEINSLPEIYHTLGFMTIETTDNSVQEYNAVYTNVHPPPFMEK